MDLVQRLALKADCSMALIWAGGLHARCCTRYLCGLLRPWKPRPRERLHSPQKAVP